MRTFKIELSEQLLLAMLQIVRTGPFNIVAPILAEIDRQIIAQQEESRPKLKAVDNE
jgi:hypothetical protein